MDHRNVRRYLRSVWKLLPGKIKEKRTVICQVRDNLMQFMEEEPFADYETIVARFGTPKQIASAYLDEMDTAELMKSLRVKRRILGAGTLGVALGLLICLITAALVYVEGVKDVTGTIETSIEEFDHTIYTEEP